MWVFLENTLNWIFSLTKFLGFRKHSKFVGFSFYKPQIKGINPFFYKKICGVFRKYSKLDFQGFRDQKSHQQNPNQQEITHVIDTNNSIFPRTKQRGKMGVKSDSTRGEIVQVQGGHIIRATGLKDRHSKVFTAKGPRDRRVRLSAHTAIQFYDVQDRLGYDRPSKAVDWLIKKAKASIDKLAELPPWDPLATGRGGSEHVQGMRFYWLEFTLLLLI